jgi:hypothetical protein
MMRYSSIGKALLSTLVGGLCGGAVLLSQFAYGDHLPIWILGNALFVAGAATGFWLVRAEENSIVTLFSVVALFLLFSIVIGSIGMVTYSPHSHVPLALMVFLALGYAPSGGPDTPLFAYLPVWMASVTGLIFLGWALVQLAGLRRNGASDKTPHA